MEAVDNIMEAAASDVDLESTPHTVPTPVRFGADYPSLMITASAPEPPSSPNSNANDSLEKRTRISHKRSCSDPSNMMNALLNSSSNDEINVSIVQNAPLRGSTGKEESNANTGKVTFAKKLPRANLSSGKLTTRRRHSGNHTSSSSTNNSSTAWTANPTNNSINTTTTSSSRVRVYRSSIAPDKLTTRDIAALDFLLNIPLEAEQSIVQHGWMLQQQRKKTYHVDDDDSEEDDFDDTTGRPEEVLLEPPGGKSSNHNNTTAQLGSTLNSHHGRWWEKWVPRDSSANTGTNNGIKRKASNVSGKVAGELELPTDSNLTDGTLPDGTPSSMHSMEGKRTSSGKSASSTNNNNNNNSSSNNNNSGHTNNSKMPTAPIYAPGRRLEGDEAILVQIPLKIDTVTRQKSIARQAAIREWEIKVAHGLMDSNNNAQPALLDGRLFLSAAGSYPMEIFSLKRYEPKREEAALRRQKLEARGGGGSHFVMPSRDWRGISFRALLPRKAEQTRNLKAFNRFLRNNRHDTKTTRKPPRRKPFDDSDKDLLSSEDDKSQTKNADNSDSDDDISVSSSSSSSSEDSYIPGILDDPEMTLGRHRNVMIGDATTGCIIASTIQFVKPALLKADLNSKFRDRFDGWEPNKAQRKYIGARVVDGVYTLIDPTEATPDDSNNGADDASNQSTQDSKNATRAIIRMPPSLTLSKIRSMKSQALRATVRANLEVGTVSLACVYFERLCLSCRVDKSNRRLCFASCLLLAAKINEPNEVLVMKEDKTSGNESGDEDEKNTNARKKIKRLESSIRPSKRSNSMFASLLEFFTQEWSLSLKHLFAAEWGVFAALRFSLHATPSQVAFHFKRLMKALEWNPRHYLGKEMYAQWQDALQTEEDRKLAREKRREIRQVRKEQRLQRELQKEILGKKDSRGSLIRRKSTSTKDAMKATVATEKGKAELADKGGVKIAFRRSTSAEIPSTVANDLSDRRQPVPRSHSARRTALSSLSGSTTAKSPHESPNRERLSLPAAGPAPGSATAMKKPRQLKLLSRLGMRRPLSSDKLVDLSRKNEGGEHDRSKFTSNLPLSPSMPMIAQAASFPDHELQLSGTSESVAIDIPPSPSGDGNERHGNSQGEDEALSEDEEKGNMNDEVGLSNIL